MDRFWLKSYPPGVPSDIDPSVYPSVVALLEEWSKMAERMTAGEQTVANGERFITPELKDMEGKILGAEERSVKLEYEIFQRVREEVLGQLPKIQQTASALAQLELKAIPARDASSLF